MNKQKVCIFTWLAVMLVTICIGIYAATSVGASEDNITAGLGSIAVMILMVMIMIPETDILIGLIYSAWKRSSEFWKVSIINKMSMIASAIALILLMFSVFEIIFDSSFEWICGLLGCTILFRIIFVVTLLVEDARN